MTVKKVQPQLFSLFHACCCWPHCAFPFHIYIYFIKFFFFWYSPFSTLMHSYIFVNIATFVVASCFLFLNIFVSAELNARTHTHTHMIVKGGGICRKPLQRKLETVAKTSGAASSRRHGQRAASSKLRANVKTVCKICT